MIRDRLGEPVYRTSTLKFPRQPGTITWLKWVYRKYHGATFEENADFLHMLFHLHSKHEYLDWIDEGEVYFPSTAEKWIDSNDERDQRYPLELHQNPADNEIRTDRWCPCMEDWSDDKLNRYREWAPRQRWERIVSTEPNSPEPGSVPQVPEDAMMTLLEEQREQYRSPVVNNNANELVHWPGSTPFDYEDDYGAVEWSNITGEPINEWKPRKVSSYEIDAQNHFRFISVTTYRNTRRPTTAVSKRLLTSEIIFNNHR